MKTVIYSLFLLTVLTACATEIGSGENQKFESEESSGTAVKLPPEWTSTPEDLSLGIFVPTFTPTPSATPTPLPTSEISPTVLHVKATPTRMQSQEYLLESFITATPFFGNDEGDRTSHFIHPGCPIQFLYPSDWAIVSHPDIVDSGECVLFFRPGDWLSYIEEAYFNLPEYAGQIVYWGTSSHGLEFGFWYEDGEWLIGWDEMIPGKHVPLVKAGDNYILRGEIEVRGYSRETDAYAGLQPILMIFISNSQGQGLSIESSPYEIEDGLELILRTIRFIDS
jgi:hypothetical protein